MDVAGHTLDQSHDGRLLTLLSREQRWPQLGLQVPVVFDQPLVVEDDVEGSLELLMTGCGLLAEEGQHLS